MNPFQLRTFSYHETTNKGVYYPEGAIEYLQAHNITGNILPLFEWGEYMIWRLYPHCRVAMDGRYETVYPETLYREYFDFLYGRKHWKVFLQKYPHQIILMRTDSIIHYMLKNEHEWQEAYIDEGSVLFVKKPPKPR